MALTSFSIWDCRTRGGISVIGLVGPFLGLDEAALDDLAHHHFKGLAVFFVKRQQKARQHGEHHNERRRAGRDAAPDQRKAGRLQAAHRQNK